MGCGTSSNPTTVQNPSKIPRNPSTNQNDYTSTPNTLNNKSVLPSIEQRGKNITSAQSNGSADSGYSEDPNTNHENSLNGTQPGRDVNNTRLTVKIDNNNKTGLSNVNDFLVQHSQKSRLGFGETFEISTIPIERKMGSLAPLKHVPRFLLENQSTTTESFTKEELNAKLAEKQEKALKKRKELENARRQASSRMGHKINHSQVTTQDEWEKPNISLQDDRRHRLTLLRDKLCQNGISQTSGLHTPRTPRSNSVNSVISDVSNLTPRRAGFLMGSTSATHFKPVYD